VVILVLVAAALITGHVAWLVAALAILVLAAL
jgi:hypothetical protein